jgi:thiol-disulfide isomerase/thioredoxin
MSPASPPRLTLVCRVVNASLPLLFFIFGTIGVFAQSNLNLPKPGGIAPALHLTNLLGAPIGVSPELPHGKAVVLEFWATWCAPCLGEIPAINALAKSVDPAKVQFISITDEDPAKIDHFLKTHPISGWVGIDAGGSVFERYGVISRPATIVIGPDGKVISNSLRPDQLSANQLLAIANGRSHHIAATAPPAKITSDVTKAQTQAIGQQFAAAGAGEAQTALFAISVNLARGTETHVYHFGPQSIEILDASVKSLLNFGLNYPETRITLDEGDFGDKRYNLSIHADDVPSDELASAVELAITSGTHARITHHREEEDVLLLHPLGSNPAAANPSKQGVAFFDPKKDNVTMLRALPEDIASAAEDVAGLAVVAEAPGVPPCDGTFPVAKGDRDALKSALERQCGLTLTPGRRTIDRITVTP